MLSPIDPLDVALHRAARNHYCKVHPLPTATLDEALDSVEHPAVEETETGTTSNPEGW